MTRLLPFRLSAGSMILAGFALIAGIAVTAMVTPGAAQAQDHAHMDHRTDDGPDLPEGWQAHFDQGHGAQAAEDLTFVDMEPGWHVTTGPSGIFYRHGDRAEGDYTVESTLHLFDPGERRESFGIFVGGEALHGEEARYTYFLIRRTGEFMVRHRAGEELNDVQGWTAHDAVRGWDDRGEDAASVANRLGVSVQGDEVAFMVNGVEVHRAERGDLDLDGHYGLRVNHNLDLHVETLGVTDRD